MIRFIRRALWWPQDEWPEAQRLLPAAQLVPVPVAPRRVARRLAVAVLAFFVFASLAPWRQNVTGSGRVIAFAPDERPQPIQATISGRIARWHVVEGQSVVSGDVLVELVDNDPDRLRRLELRKEAAEQQVEAYRGQVRAYQERLDALREAQQAQIAAARAEVEVAQQSLQAKQELLAAAQASVETAAIQQSRVQRLAEQGLSSQRERELAELSATSAAAELQSANAELRAARSNLETKRAALQRVQASSEATLQSARASVQSAETQVASAVSALAGLESDVAQQRAQVVTAPRSGMVQRISLQQGGAQVSRGQTLAYLVPQVSSRAVELYVDGNDAALITPGRHVRLQFEGWPAVQFSGWPSVAVGTFGGTVAFVDPSDDGRGDFRVVILPDDEDEDWPTTRFLRQGTRTKGWVLLEEVRVGFEIWRQLNGFPPAYRQAPESEAQIGPAYGAAYDGASADYGSAGGTK